MKLTTEKCLKLLAAIERLAGSTRVVVVNGKQQVVLEPYDFTDKVTWNLMKNRRVLTGIKELADEHGKKLGADLRDLIGKLNKDADPKENEAKAAAFEAAANAKLETFLQQENDLTGLLKIPVVGLKLKVNKIPHPVLDELGDLLEGEPEFEEAATAGKK